MNIIDHPLFVKRCGNRNKIEYHDFFGEWCKSISAVIVAMPPESAKSVCSRRGENPRPTVLVATRVKFHAVNRFSPDEKRDSKIVPRHGRGVKNYLQYFLFSS